MKFSWTQPICANCWNEHNPDRPVGELLPNGMEEKCCHCGITTFSGIYIRIDPTTVGHPSLTK